MDALSDEETGRLMKAVWRYTMTGKRQRLSGPASGMLVMILAALDQDAERDAALSEKRAAAGSEGGRNKPGKSAETEAAEQTQTNEADAGSAKQMQANEANAYNKNQNKNQRQKQRQNQRQKQNQNRRKTKKDDDDVDVGDSRAREDADGIITEFPSRPDSSTPHEGEDDCMGSPGFMPDSCYPHAAWDGQQYPSLPEEYTAIFPYGDREELSPEELEDEKCGRIVSTAITAYTGRKAMPAESHLIAVKTRLFGLSPQMAALAVKMAAEHGARNIVQYVDRIFETWLLEKVKTPAEEMEYRLMYEEAEEAKRFDPDNLDMFFRMDKARKQREEAHEQREREASGDSRYGLADYGTPAENGCARNAIGHQYGLCVP